MNTLFKHKILVWAMLSGFMFFGASCEDTQEINVTPETPFADKTLLEIMRLDSDINDFMEVLDSCGSHCADSLFAHPRVYTVWAPVSINKDSLLDRIAKGYRDDVFNTFISGHIANHLVAANGKIENNAILVLNNKKVEFNGNPVDGYTFSNVKLKERNIRAKNGILHKIHSLSEYEYSIWEYLKIAENVDSVSKYLFKYDVTDFNEGLSIKGPIVNGEQTYVDSVFTTTNRWLDAWNGVGNLDNEDSSYVVYVPSNEMWIREIQKAESQYTSDPTWVLAPAVQYERDSLRSYNARLHNLKYMTYSLNEQRHLDATDSMMPAYRGVYRRPMFRTEELDRNVIFEKQLSNGVFKVVDAMPYKPTDLWLDTIFIECENQSMWDLTSYPNGVKPSDVTTADAFDNMLNKKDSTLIGSHVSGGRYFRFYREESAGTAFFKIPKIMATKYHVAIIVVPDHITREDIDTATLNPNKFEMAIRYQPGVGAPEILYLATEADDESKNNGALFSDPHKLDTLFLTTNGEKAEVTFPYSEFYDGEAKDYNVYFEVKTVAATKSEQRKGILYDVSIRLDKIMLIPIPEEE